MLSNYSTSSPLWVRSIYLCLQAQTDQASQLFSECGIELAENTKKQNRVAIVKITQLWDAIIKLTEDDAFGLEVGQHFVRNAAEVFTLTAISSDDLLEAAQRLSVFYKMVSTGVVLGINTQKGVELNLSLPKNATGVCMYAMDASLTTLVELTKTILKEHYQSPKRVQMCRPEPRQAKEFNDYFGCEVEFNCSQNSILYDDKNIEFDSTSKNPALANHLYNYLNESLQELTTLTLTQQVSHTIDSLFDNRSVNVNEVAREMAMSERTLQRKLRQEGSSFNEINKQFKLQKAQYWLLEKKLRQGEIGHRLGFSSQSNFSRFFKLETGYSPNGYMSNLRN
jgi:AraC-like DNA-binding protein